MDGAIEIFELHELVYVLGILTALAGLARFYFTRRTDRDELIKWRTNVDNDLSNLNSYTTRIERERKEADRAHEGTFDRINEKLDGLKDGQTRIETELKAHRKVCEDRLRKG